MLHSPELLRLDIRYKAQFSSATEKFYVIHGNISHDAKPLSDKELLDRYERISAKATFAHFKEMWDRFEARKNESGLAMMRTKLTARMNDVSGFMYELKLRFTRWYNVIHGLKGGGTFWTDRFKSNCVFFDAKKSGIF